MAPVVSQEYFLRLMGNSMGVRGTVGEDVTGWRVGLRVGFSVAVAEATGERVGAGVVSVLPPPPVLPPLPLLPWEWTNAAGERSKRRTRDKLR